MKTIENTKEIIKIKKSVIDDSKKIINKGTGAGGSNTTKNGTLFENKTSIESKLIENNYIKHIINNNEKHYYFENNYNNNKYNNKNNKKKIIYMKQNNFKLFLEKEFDVDPEDIYRKPDEAFLIISNNDYHLKILEKKNQNEEGSVEEKIKNGQFNIREYQKMLKDLFKDNKCKLTISYAFCISDFLKNKFTSDKKKYIIWNELLKEDNIKMFYGDDKNYLDNIFEWINN